MSFQNQPNVSVYTQGFGTSTLNVQTPHIDVRNPSNTDTNFPVGKKWINGIGNTTYTLTSLVTVNGATSAIWTPEGGGTVALETLTGNTGGAVFPTAGNINVLGSGTVATAGSGSTLTISATASGYPVTPFVVGPSGKAGYQTVQSAVTAAGAAGGGTVYIQDGSYSESLTIPAGVSLVGNDLNVSITGAHTVTGSGSCNFRNILFVATTNVIFNTSSAAVNFFFDNCIWTVSNGWVISSTTITGSIYMNNCRDQSSTNNGIIFANTSTVTAVIITDSNIGSGTSNTLTINATFFYIIGSRILCPTLSLIGTTFFQSTSFAALITLATTTTGVITGCEIDTGSSVAITFTTSNAFTITNTTINTSNNPAIGGSGTGTLTLATVTFLNNANISNTLTVILVAAKGTISGPAVSVNRTVPVFNSTLANSVADTGVVIDTSNNFTAFGGAPGNITGQLITTTTSVVLTTTAANGEITLTPTGSGAAAVNGAFGVTGLSTFTGGWSVPAGGTVSLATGLPGDPVSIGKATLGAGGLVDVLTSNVTANSLIFVTANTVSGTQGMLNVPDANRVAGTSFRIVSSNNADRSTVNWILYN